MTTNESEHMSLNDSPPSSIQMRSVEVVSEVNQVRVETHNTGSEKEIVAQLSLQLLEQSELTNKLQHHIATLNTQLNQSKQQLVQARKEKHEADLEVTRLSTEVENITQELFEQANVQVAEANEGAYNVKQLNDRLAQTIKEKDTTIEILQAELASLKHIITNTEYQSPLAADEKNNKSSGNILTESQQGQTKLPDQAHLKSRLLAPYNEKVIYSPTFNQIRFDLPPFAVFSEALIPRKSETSGWVYDLKSSKFYTKLLEELESALRLDKAPALQSTLKMRWNKKTFLQNLMERNVNIQPLSAATEVWKIQTLQKYDPNSASSEIVSANQSEDETLPLTRVSTISQQDTSYDPELFSLAANSSKPPSNAAPLAVVSSCGFCGEKRKDLNFSRLYHLRLEPSTDDKSHKQDYPICINCANRYRAAVELLKFVACLNPLNLQPNYELDDYIRASWMKFVMLKSKFWYATSVGIWSEKEVCGLVYGWQNEWLVNKRQIPESQAEESNNLTGPMSNSKIEKEIDFPIEKSEDLPEETDTAAEESSTLAKRKSKDWSGWSEVLAQTTTDDNLKVGVELGKDLSQPKGELTSNSIDSKSGDSESAEENEFQDAHDSDNGEQLSDAPTPSEEDAE